jgi:SAM-dependent methyltransferase
MADVIRPFLGTRLLEIGSGTGAMTRRLVPRDLYVASEVDPLHLETLRNLGTDRPYLTARYTDVTDISSYPRVEGGFDSVVCLNVIEHVDDDVGALRNVREALAHGGRAVVLVPSGPWNFGTLDEALGHRRRYTVDGLREVAERAGLAVTEVIPFNRLSSLPWWVNGRLLRRRSAGRFQIGTVDWLTPAARRLDRFLPLPPLSLVAVMERRPD